jgi:hypothetical protein
MAEKRKSIKDPMKSGKDFGSPFDIFKAKLNKETVKSLKQPTGGLTGKKSKYSASPSVKLKKETLKKLAANKTAAQKAKTKAKAKTQTKSTTSKSKSAPRAVDKGGRLSARGSEGYKPTKTNMGPNMAKVNKPDTPRAKKVDLKKRGPSGPTMTSMGRPSTGPKPRNKDPKVNLKKRGPSRPSMTGFKRGGSIDGCAKRGLTRAKRSR